ncbi:MAG: hypothetical protein HY816_14585 [Candidatus Wallbacteria bacterium]|nr:hypothetical protein [Candidatus Wallbacteria bacterium]
MSVRVRAMRPVLWLAVVGALALTVPARCETDGAESGVRPLMERLLHLVKRDYAEVATLDARLRRPAPGADVDSLQTELATRIAAFQERERKILARMPRVESEDPEMARELAAYRRELERMESRVLEMASRHDLETRVADLVAASESEEADEGVARDPQPRARADEEPSEWEQARAGAPAPRRQARMVTALGSRALPEPSRNSSSGDIAELVQRVRESHKAAADKQIQIDLDKPAPAAPAAVAARPENRIVPVVLEVRDQADQPVVRRRVEFIVETDPGAPVTAQLLEGGNRVTGTSLVEITDESGRAYVDLKLEGEDRKVRIERTVIAQPDRTVCRMRVMPL